MELQIRNISKRFGAFTALDDVSLNAERGELVALLGPSGSGKTTLLRIIAGLEAPDGGQVLIQGEDCTRQGPRDRGVGLVFQHYALFNHLSVFDNVAFGLKVRRRSRELVHARVQELLTWVQLDGLERRFPAQLSGGQRQRVALARALAVEPKLLLLDEPFGALDARVRQELRKWLRKLHDEIQLTSVFVTHDQDEAFEVADRVVVMNHGRVEQTGTAEELFDCPASAFVADFLGDANVLRGCVTCGRALFGSLDVPYPDYPEETPLPAVAYLHNRDVELRAHKNGGGDLPVRVAWSKPTGRAVKLMLVAQPCRSTLHLELRPEEWDRLGLHTGDTAYLHARRLSVFLEDPDELGTVAGDQTPGAAEAVRTA